MLLPPPIMPPALAETPMPVYRIDTRSAVESLERLRRAGPDGRKQLVRVLGATFVVAVLDNPPQDTGRYRNGWAEAANQAGVASVAVLPLRPSQWLDRHTRMLEQQLERLKKAEAKLLKPLDEWFDSRREAGRKVKVGAWERRMRSELKRVQRRREAAERELAKLSGATAALFIYGRQGRISEKTGRRIGERLHTVRDTVYGGEGRIIEVNGEHVAELINREPHSKFVERRYRTVFHAMGPAMRVGAVRASRTWMQSMDRAAAGRAA